MARVLLKDVCKNYGNFQAVKNVNLEIADKEFVVLVGPSGCGKSTTLRMIAGLEEVTSGEIYIGDRLVNDVPPKDRDIAMVFQNYALYPHMNVYQNMSFALRLRKMPKAEIQRRVNEAAELLDIASLMKRKPKELSGGQRQRVALGRAIVREPRAFLLDEPLSNLDAKLRVQMRSEISKLHQRLEATIIYVTHDQVEAMTMGDRIVVMKDGIIQQVGQPLDIYERPINAFVAGFIGSPAMNFFPCRLTEEDNQLIIQTSGFSVPIPENRLHNIDQLRSYNGKELIFGIRPEDIVDSSTEGVTHETPYINVAVEVVEPMGNECFVHGRIGSDPFIARVDAHTTARPNKQHQVSLRLSKMHLFDQTTELAII